MQKICLLRVIKLDFLKVAKAGTKWLIYASVWSVPRDLNSSIIMSRVYEKSYTKDDYQESKSQAYQFMSFEI